MTRAALFMPAGVLADMYDRRKIALTGLCFSSANSAILCVLAWQQLLTPIVVLASCFLIGSGMAAYSPAWHCCEPGETACQDRKE